jgi:hypothetical protein
MGPNRKFVLSKTAQFDAQTVKDALYAERLGFAVAWRESHRLDEPRPVVVAPDEVLRDAQNYEVLARLAEVSGCVLRWESERPAVSVEYARLRGFSDEEIRAELRPWLAEGVARSEAEVEKQAAALRQAEADLAAARQRAAAPVDLPTEVNVAALVAEAERQTPNGTPA